MEILKKEEFSNFIPKESGRRKSSIRKEAFNLAVGEFLFVPKREFKSYGYSKKTNIGQLLWHEEKKYTTKTGKMKGIDGTAIIRKK